MNQYTPFVPPPQYSNILTAPDEVVPWVHSLKDMSLSERVASLNSTFFQPDFDAFWLQDPASANYLKSLDIFYKKTFGQTLQTVPAAKSNATSKVSESFFSTTSSNRLISETYLGISTVFANLPANRDTKVLEMGCGWGTVGLELIRTGYDVTFLDTRPTHQKSITSWAKKLGAPKARFVHSDLEAVADHLEDGETFDAVFFYRSFQKSLRPAKVIEACHRILRPGGSLLLVGEPIHGNFYVPWGPRCDGTSLASMVNTGKVELGYDANFIDTVAESAGFEKVGRKRVPGNASQGHDLFKRK